MEKEKRDVYVGVARKVGDCHFGLPDFLQQSWCVSHCHLLQPCVPQGISVKWLLQSDATATVCRTRISSRMSRKEGTEMLLLTEKEIQGSKESLLRSPLTSAHSSLLPFKSDRRLEECTESGQNGQRCATGDIPFSGTSITPLRILLPRRR